MAEADRIAAALRYQQELDNAQRPAFGNPNMLAQGRKMNLPERQAYSAEAPDWMAKGLPMEGRATILPFRDTESKREIALPGLIASALNSMTAPGRAFSGSDPTFDPMSEGIDFALNTMGGGMAASKAAPVGDGLLGMNLRTAPSSAQFVKADVVGAADDLTALAKSMGLDVEVRHSGSNAGKSSYVSVSDPMTNRYIKSSFRISDHGTGPLRHQEHIHINSPADLATQKNDLFEWVKRNRTEKGVDTTNLSAPSQGTTERE